MTEVDASLDLSRRQVLKSGVATLVVAAVTPAGAVLGVNGAWAAEPQALKPQSFATLVQMSRDLYPHDRLEDKFYAAAVSVLDTASKTDAGLKAMLENGAAALDKGAASGGANPYTSLKDEAKRVALIKASASDFMQKVRGNLITGLYNNKEVWPIFGYEGESASKGGYLNRGFNDLNWV
jgi:hypothetical protein